MRICRSLQLVIAGEINDPELCHPKVEKRVVLVIGSDLGFGSGLLFGGEEELTVGADVHERLHPGVHPWRGTMRKLLGGIEGAGGEVGESGFFFSKIDSGRG